MQITRVCTASATRCSSTPCISHVKTCNSHKIVSLRRPSQKNRQFRTSLHTCRVFDQFKSWLTPGGGQNQPPAEEPLEEEEEEPYELNDEGGTMVRIGGDEENTGLGRSEAFGPLVSLVCFKVLILFGHACARYHTGSDQGCLGCGQLTDPRRTTAGHSGG